MASLLRMVNKKIELMIVVLIAIFFLLPMIPYTPACNGVFCPPSQGFYASPSLYLTGTGGLFWSNHSEYRLVFNGIVVFG
jgi:hypothetical protein